MSEATVIFDTRFERHIISYLNGNLGTFKEWYSLLSDCDKDEFIIYVTLNKGAYLEAETKIRIFSFLLRSLI